VLGYLDRLMIGAKSAWNKFPVAGHQDIAFKFFRKKLWIPLHRGPLTVKFDSVQQPQNQKNGQDKKRKEDDQEATHKDSQTKEGCQKDQEVRHCRTPVYRLFSTAQLPAVLFFLNTRQTSLH